MSKFYLGLLLLILEANCLNTCIELPDTITVNLVASPMVSSTQYGLDQMFGNTWSWSLNYSLELDKVSAECSDSHFIADLCEVNSPVQNPIETINFHSITMIDMDFFRGNLLFISFQNKLKQASISVSNYIIPLYSDVALISCNSNKGQFCIIYKITGELCKLNEKLELESCYKIMEKPNRIQLLSNNRAVLYYDNTIEIYNVVTNVSLIEKKFSGVTDIAVLDTLSFIICKEGYISFWNSSIIFKETKVKCKRVVTYNNTLIVYKTPNDGDYLIEYLIDKKNKELKMIRGYNDNYIKPPEDKLSTEKLLIDDKYFYFFNGNNTMIVKHSLPLDLPNLITPIDFKATHFALNFIQSQSYSYETESFLALYENDKIVLTSPYTFTPGVLTCKFGNIKEASDWSFKMKLKSVIPNCPEREEENYDACIYIRNINITRIQETKGSSDAITIFLTITLPCIVIAGYFLLNVSTSKHKKGDLLEKRIDLASIKK